MKRKQMYIRDDQDTAIKEIAVATGMPYAEIVRRMLDIALAQRSRIVTLNIICGEENEPQQEDKYNE